MKTYRRQLLVVQVSFISPKCPKRTKRRQPWEPISWTIHKNFCHMWRQYNQDDRRWLQPRVTIVVIQPKGDSNIYLNHKVCEIYYLTIMWWPTYLNSQRILSASCWNFKSILWNILNFIQFQAEHSAVLISAILFQTQEEKVQKCFFAKWINFSFLKYKRNF